MSKELRAARLSIISNTVLLILKFGIGSLTGSVALISEAIHSGLDLLASTIAWFGIRLSSGPPDSFHPYGKEKWQNMSGTLEATLVLISALWIAGEALLKLSHPEPVQFLGWGVVVMTLCILVNFLVSTYIYQVARETQSLALEADAMHLRADLQSSLGVLTGLVLMWILHKFGYEVHWLDSLIALLVGGFILSEAWQIFKKSFLPLLDQALDQELVQQIHQLLQNQPYAYHKLRTRSSGSKIFVDFHLVLPPTMTLEKASQIKLDLKAQITQLLTADITIQFDIESRS